MTREKRYPPTRSCPESVSTKGFFGRTSMVWPLLLFLSFVICHSSFASLPASSLEGSVVDWVSGAPIPDVSVVVRGTDRPVTREVLTNRLGNFFVPLLPAGIYSVTAVRTGYSTVTLVGVVVHPGDERRVEIKVSVVAEEESVTETVSDEHLVTGLAKGWILPSRQSESLPLFRGSIDEVARLYPGAGRVTIVEGAGEQPVESTGVTSILLEPNGANVARVSSRTVASLPRWGDDGLQGSVRLVYGERLTRSQTERRSGSERSQDEWIRGVLTIGGKSADRRLTGFMSIDHRDDRRDYVVASGGIDPELDGQAFDASGSRAGFAATLAVEADTRQALFLVASGSRSEGPMRASSLTAPAAGKESEAEDFSLRATHALQVSERIANLLELGFEYESSRLTGERGQSYLFPSGYRSNGAADSRVSSRSSAVRVNERFSWALEGSRIRHVLRAGLGTRIGLDERRDYQPALGSVVFLGDAIDSPATDITVMSGGGTFDGTWNEAGVWVEDEVSSSSLRVRIGARVDWWDGLELDQSGNGIWRALESQSTYRERYLTAFAGSTSNVALDGVELSPRADLSWSLDPESTTVIRAGWGRFHEVPDPPGTLTLPSLYATGRLGVTYHTNDTQGVRQSDGSEWHPGQPLPPADAMGFLANEVISPDMRAMRTDRFAAGISRDLSGIAVVTLDVVSSRLRNVPYLLRANPRLDASGVPQADRRFPDLGDFRIRMFDGEVDVLTVSLGARLDLFGKVDAIAAYTWSETDGNVRSDFDESHVPEQPDSLVGRFASIDPLNPFCEACFGPLDGQPEHRGSIAFRSNLPADWELAAIARYRSGLPYTRFDPRLADTNGDGFRQDLAAEADHVNDRRGPTSTMLDLSIAKRLEVGGVSARVALDAFNVTGDDAPSGVNRFGAATTFAGDVDAPPGRSLALNVLFRFDGAR